MASAEGKVFTVQPLLVLALAAAGLFWLVMLVCLWPLRALAPGTELGCAVFALYFALQWGWSARVRVELGSQALSIRGLLRQRSVRYEEILGVEVFRSLGLTLYRVVSVGGGLHFSSHLRHHRELLLLLEARLGGPRG